MPLFGDVERFLEGARCFESSPTEEASEYFERRILECFLDKLRVGIDVPNYPQFRDMNKMFLEMIKGAKKTKDGYTETDILSLAPKESRMPEVSVIRRNSQQIHEKIGEPFQVRICVTGPHTLSSLFPYRDERIISRLGEMILRIVENNLFDTKHGSVSLVTLDEPTFGLLDDPLIDWGSEGRERLQTAWESIFRKARSKKTQTCIHLHNTADELFWNVKHLNIIESHADDPLYHAKKTKEALESTDKFLKASVCVTDIDRLIRESITTASQQKTSEFTISEGIANTWKQFRDEKLDPEIFLESDKLMTKRLIKMVRQFGVERIPYAGPECGLGGFPTYECALGYLRRVSGVVKRANT
jgi:5-methyltetrahydropteroyltriglutamate--homocysteine methyltransferase